MARLSEKIAVITGGAGGIGQAAAKHFAAEGARVVLVDRDESALQSVVRPWGGRCKLRCRRRYPTKTGPRIRQ
ncbi:MAG: hypothetical protein CM1200mP22_23610 [Dehalococcoidia bacterium]|nr:MAG: hypothetical protein CM1200mP22_23610 [Dehalococcoidia bacterium]